MRVAKSRSRLWWLVPLNPPPDDTAADAAGMGGRAATGAALVPVVFEEVDVARRNCAKLWAIEVGAGAGVLALAPVND